jgi:hypothetical protein
MAGLRQQARNRWAILAGCRASQILLSTGRDPSPALTGRHWRRRSCLGPLTTIALLKALSPHPFRPHVF